LFFGISAADFKWLVYVFEIGFVVGMLREHWNIISKYVKTKNMINGKVPINAIHLNEFDSIPIFRLN
jgi:hypothetical protein